MATALNIKLGRVEHMMREIETSTDQEDAQKKYMAAVGIYNEAIARFPGFLIAGLLGLKTISADSKES